MNKKSKLPLYLIHGRLGAGKTSIISNLAKTERFKHAFVIENEFAHESIDGPILGSHFGQNNIFEISGGCICCSSGAELLDVLQKIADKNTGEPMPVIVETTGVASSAQLLKQLLLSDIFHKDYYLAKNVLVLDALEANPSTLDGWRLDVQLADLVVINKKDLVSASKIADFEKSLRKIRTDIKYSVVADGAVDAALISDHIPSSAEQFLVEHIGDIADALAVDHSASVEYRILSARQPIAKDAFRENLQELQANNTAPFRVKGYFKSPDGEIWHIEGTPNHIAFESVQGNHPLKIVAIGKELPDNLFSFFAK